MKKKVVVDPKKLFDAWKNFKPIIPFRFTVAAMKARQNKP